MQYVLISDTDADALLAPLLKLHAETILLPLLVQLALIILAARVFCILFRKFGQPGVVGEIAAGLILGPSVFGYFFPGAFNAVFHPTVEGVDPKLFGVLLDSIFNALAHLGLILLLFLVGLRFDFSHLRLRSKSAVTISAAGVLLPFGLGLLLALLVHPLLEPHPLATGPVDRLGFSLFLGTAMSITALPVLSRIMLDLGIVRSRVGSMTLACAAVDDVSGWILLATVTAIVRGNFELWPILRMIGFTLLFVGVMLFVVKPLLGRWARSALRRGKGGLSLNDLAIVLTLMMLGAVATNLIGIYAIFGAFFLGVVLSDETEFARAVDAQLNDFVTVFFLPIFFTYTGLRTEVGSIGSAQMWLVFAGVLFAAIGGKFAGCGLAARYTGSSPREAACIGLLMNTRGLMELIVINVGYRLEVIPKSMYCILVLMALITTIMTTPLMLRLMRGTELAEYVNASGFLGKKRLLVGNDKLSMASVGSSEIDSAK